MAPGGNPFLGGSVIGISRYSKKKQASLDFLKWISRDDMNTALTLLGECLQERLLMKTARLKIPIHG